MLALNDRIHKLQVEQQLRPFALARPHSLCVAAANTLHLLHTGSGGDQPEKRDEAEHNGMPMLFEFSELSLLGIIKSG